MDATPQAAPAARGRTDTKPLRIVHAGGEDVPADPFGWAAAHGFDHVCVAPPWPAGRTPYLSRSLPAGSEGSPDKLSGLATRAKAAGVGLILDVVLDRVAADGELAKADSPFRAPTRDSLLDPRHSDGAEAAHAVLDTLGDALTLASWWAARLGAWHAAGVAGFRLVGLAALTPPLLAGFAGALRRDVQAAKLLAWTPGLSREALRALEGRGLDGVFSSLPWWDWQSDWLWDELQALMRVAPVLGLDGRPMDDRLPRYAAAARATSLAAVVGQGWMHVPATLVEAPGVFALNAALAAAPAMWARFPPSLPLGDAGRALALLRTDAADHRSAGLATLAVVNGDNRSINLRGEALLVATGGVFESFAALLATDTPQLSPTSEVTLPPGGLALYAATARRAAPAPARADAGAAAAAALAPRLAIERPTPCVDGGAFPVKATAGELVSVEADIVFDGHDKIAAALRWRGPEAGSWREAPMRPLGNDRWQAVLPLEDIGRHAYVVLAWRDRFETFRDELAKKSAAGVNISLELIEGRSLLEAAAARGTGSLRASLHEVLASLRSEDEPAQVATFLAPEIARLMSQADDRPFQVQTGEIPVDAERIEARFASWYEVFPRSLSDDPARHGTFADVERHLPRIAGMGFDVLYFPPIHPIGRKNRKGRNNSLTPAPEDPGSPYAIGSHEGGHDALHSELGTLEDFARLRQAAAEHGLELAIDFAVQCSPDHPWLKQHPGWFDWRPDGTIRYAENPPKKYEDIVNVDFYAKDAVPELWTALCDVVLFWARQGVRLFRVDNPHTKPFPFWQWLIGTVRAQYPDAVFLAEAFTRPKVMYRLAKIGFSQSYTYFTWRNSKRELEEYLTELDTEAPRDFFRPHFFVNTPDINPVFLQTSGRPGFLIRAALAATLSGLWGVYNGFELCEAAAVAGKEEYLDSEKYQLRAWDWDRPGNIVAEITALNRLRRQNPALQTHRGVTFLVARNDAILFYEKSTPDRSNVVIVAVSLDPFAAQEADIEIPLWRAKLPDDASLPMQDLLGGSVFAWHGKYQRLRLTPESPYAIWRVRTL